MLTPPRAIENSRIECGAPSQRAGIHVPALDVAKRRFLSLGVGPYLAVDALNEALAVLGALLELAQVLELICGKLIELLGDLRDGQSLVVVRLQGAKHACPKLRLAGGLFSLTQDLLGPLGGLLGHAQPCLATCSVASAPCSTTR